MVEFHPIICGYEVGFRVIGTPVVLECDGWAYHGLKRTVFERNRDRDADLIAARWIVVRFTYRAITVRPKVTADRIAVAVARITETPGLRDRMVRVSPWAGVPIIATQQVERVRECPSGRRRVDTGFPSQEAAIRGRATTPSSVSSARARS